jgi:UPF0755 protein
VNNKVNARPYLLIALVISLGFSIYTATRPSHEFPSNKPGVDVVVQVAQGEYGSSIAKKLQDLGVIREASTFTALANRPNSGAQGISPGSHKIQSHITSVMALEQLLDRKRFTDLVNVIEGSTVSDVVKELAKDSNVSKSSYAMVKPYLGNSRNSLEGQLAPASYSFAAQTPTSKALQSMVDGFSRSVKDLSLNKGFGKYSAYEVLTIASMVQIEGDPTDYAKVAGVIYNRLKIGMPLQLNSTVQYAAGLRGQIALSTKATQIESAYNTYKHVGLPPTPISNPSLAAIKASLKPELHPYLYFITVKPHDTRFTKDFTQFDIWVTEYNKNRAAGLFK